jgi:hypothetical protein
MNSHLSLYCLPPTCISLYIIILREVSKEYNNGRSLYLTVSTPKYSDQQRKHIMQTPPLYELLYDTPLEHTNG